MFAVVEVGSTQYSVQEKDEILVDLMDLEEGKNYMAPKVLLYSEDGGGNTLVGMPYLENVKVEMRVMGHEQGPKIRVFKMKAKKRYQRTIGHRSDYTRLKVLKISVLSGSAAKKATEEVVEEKPTSEAKPKAAKSTAETKPKAAAKKPAKKAAPKKSE